MKIMVLMDDESLSSWCMAHSLILRGRNLRLSASTDMFVVIETPTSGHEQIGLAGDILSLGGFDEASEDMIWISLWGIWNDWNRDLGESIIVGMRASKESGIVSLDTASAQVLSVRERKLSVGIFLQLMLFRWDGWLTSGQADYLVQCSHDGLIWITCRNQVVQSRILAELDAWQPQIRAMRTSSNV